jgi:hypothetical protein
MVSKGDIELLYFITFTFKQSWQLHPSNPLGSFTESAS